MFLSFYNDNDIKKLALPLIITFTLLFSLLIIAFTPPADGYELSIYWAYPAFLWIVISINFFSSILAIIQSNKRQSKNAYYGYFSILLIETIILLLPTIRDYYSMSRGGGDIYHHILIGSQITTTGHIPPIDMYPIMHIWLSILHEFSTPLIFLTIFFAILFFILYVLSLYCLGKTILGSVNGGISVSIFGIPLIFSYAHYAFYPFLFALLLIPLILYLYQKIILIPKQRNNFYICLVFLSFFIVFCHPMITIFLIIIFFIFALYEFLKRWKSVTSHKNFIAINIVAIVSVTFSFWLIQFRSLLNTLQKIVSALVGQGTYTSILEYQVNLLTTSSASIWLVIDRFIKIYGSICTYFFISLLFLSYTIYQYYRYKSINENDLIYSLQFCVATFVGIALITGFFVIFEPIRALMYGIIFATIMCGLFFYRICFSPQSGKRKIGLIISITMTILIVCMLSMLTLYSSPWISGTSTALTNGDKKGIDWILEYRNPDIPIVKNEESIRPYLNYYHGSTNARNFQKFIEYTNIIPSNFGYNKNTLISDSFAYLPDNEVYMITTELMKLTPYAIPVDRRDLLKSYTNSDFMHLMNDPSVNLLYSNNNFGVWNINI